jgi:DNA-binding CsgD family transcriptional regulator
MEQLEFYIYEQELWCRRADGRNEVVTEHDTELVQPLLERIREQYPEAYKALEKEYQKVSIYVPRYQFLIVRRFCKCNFGRLDTTKMDVDGSGAFNFEKVECPLRGECRYEGKICFPKFNTRLSDAELRVMRLVYDGVSKDDIAERLYLSPNTVKNHIKSVYCKLGIHEKSEFIQYANRNHLFS